MTQVVSFISHLTDTSIPMELATATAEFPNIDVTVVSFYDNEASEEYGLSIVPLQATSRFDLAAFLRLFQLLRRNDVDVLHTHDNFIGSVARILGTLAGVSIVDTEHRQHDSFTWLQNFVNAPTLSLADKVVANSQATEQSFLPLEQRLLGSNQVEVVYNGVDVDQIGFTMDRVTCDDPKPIQIVTVGRLVKVKNQKVLLEAFSQLADVAADTRLVVIGDGPLRDDLERHAESLSIRQRVQFLGEIPRKEVYQQLALSDLFVMPSISEGFCVAVVEAMAAGLPVVVSDIDVFHEVVGEPGIFVDPNNPSAFADTIADLIESRQKREQLGEQAEQRARSKFSLERTAREYYNIYKAVAKTSKQ